MPRTKTRTHLRLEGLLSPDRGESRMMNVKVPSATVDSIEKLAKFVGATKTDVVIALLNEGLAARERMKK